MTPTAAPDHRAVIRFDTSLPVDLEGVPGEAHNISAHGICFETNTEQRVGELVNFTVEFFLYGRRHRLLCEGKVVRVAARLVAPFFDGIEEVSL